MADTGLIVRAQSQIRQAILSDWAARYRALGKELDNGPESDSNQLADALSSQLERYELEALRLTLHAFPDTAPDEVALKHAAMIGLERKPATTAIVRVSVSGAAGSAYTTGHVLSRADGTQYKPLSGGALPAGSGTRTASIRVVAQKPGTVGNAIDESIFTWQSAPIGFNSTATVEATETVASDEEPIADLVARVLTWWRARPGSGNRADWVEWAESRAGVSAAYVYRETVGTTPHTPGGVTLLVLGPPNQRTAPPPYGSEPFGIGPGNIADVLDYLRGEGAYAGTGGKIPAIMDPDDVTVATPTPFPVDVQLVVTYADDHPPPFAGFYTVDVGSTDTRVVLTADPSAPGASKVEIGDAVAVPVVGVRGMYQLRHVANVSPVGTSPHYIDVDAALASPASAGLAVYPAPDCWQAVFDAVLAVFDRLGPGDVDVSRYPKSGRYPSSVDRGPSGLYQMAIVAAAMGIPGLVAGVSGIVNAVAIDPGADFTPDPFAQAVPGRIVVKSS